MGTLLQQGEFISDGKTQEIELPGNADYFVAQNLSQSGSVETPGRGVKFEWFKSPEFSNGYQLRTFKSAGANTLERTVDTSGGFSFYETLPIQGPAVTGTAITAANPAVVTMNNTFSDGDRVALYGTTGMQQIAGADFTISSVSGSAFTLLGLDASGFAAAATAVIARRIPKRKDVLPSTSIVTAITQAKKAVVTTSVAHDYVVGQLLHLSVPSSFGMTEADQRTVKVVAVTAYSLTLDLDTTSFTAFSFPASASVPSSRLFATVAPAGQKNSYDVTNVPFRSGNFVPFISLPAGINSPAGSNGDFIIWQAWKREN
jgi:hypothetical protein